jgi:uncharacterized protein YndB with AHSA1/START domain
MHSITLHRIVTAERELVYRAWTDPAELEWYLNPDNESFEPIEVDLRVGGIWTIDMFISDETRYATGGLYLELIPPERIVFAFGAVDGWPELDPDNLADVPTVTITLADVGTSTDLTLHMTYPERFAGITPQMEAGWGDTIDRLVEKFAS